MESADLGYLKSRVIRQQPKVHDTFVSEELVLLSYAKGCYHPLSVGKSGQEALFSAAGR